MKARFNEDLLLWAIGVLQPASIGDALALIREIFPEITSLPLVSDLEPVVAAWVEEKWLVRVHGKSRLYSMTYAGNQRLSIPLRRHRDKTRLFLLKAAHTASFGASGEAQQGLAGVSPAVNGSSGTQEGSRPISSDAVPREPRNPVRTYWPRVVKQLAFKVGSEPRSPDTYFDYYSFPTVSSIHDASGSQTSQTDLNIIDLGVAIGISPRLITAFIHKPSHHYRQFEIRKRGGGVRVINSPKNFLKIIQYWLLDYVLFDLPVHETCHAYQNGRSIQSNAKPHVGQLYVGNIDIKDFFGSITRKMLEELLVKNGVGLLFSRTISRLTTLDDALPQGAPTSPLLSNAFLYSFDSDMHEFVSNFGLNYTRYADDITVSGNDRELIVGAMEYASGLLKERGLSLNNKKTRIASRSGQQKVTGVVVNEKLQPPRVMRRMVRAMFHNASNYPQEFVHRLHELRGYLSYLQSFSALRDSYEIERYRSVLLCVKKESKKEQ